MKPTRTIPPRIPYRTTTLRATTSTRLGGGFRRRGQYQYRQRHLLRHGAKGVAGHYKIWGSPSVNDAPPEDVWITALNDAVTDGMDVINMSSGGTALTGALDTGAACGISANTPCDALATAFENAAKTVVVVVAAGNAGTTIRSSPGDFTYPSFNTISSPATAPSVITVGATTNSHAMGPSVKVLGTGVPSNLANITAIPSDAYFYPSAYGSNSATLIDAASAGDAYACNALAPGSLNGAIALVSAVHWRQRLRL